MSTWLALLLIQGCLGAADTLWYHEHVYALPANTPQTSPELRLHAARDFVYALLFLTLPFVSWCGIWALALGALLALEIGITLADFALEDRVRAPFGGVATGERVMHAIMGLVYGAFLASFAPELVRWWSLETGFPSRPAVPYIVSATFALLGLGVLVSGLRDLGASFGLRSLQRAWFGTRAGPSARGSVSAEQIGPVGRPVRKT